MESDRTRLHHHRKLSIGFRRAEARDPTFGRLSPAATLDSFLSAVSRPGEYALLPIEAASSGGRSFQAWLRNGFLELQERLPEEVTVAAVWIFGVKWFKNKLANVLKTVQPDIGHLDFVNVDWSLWKQKSVDLTPLERYTRHAADGRALLKLKALQLGLSVPPVLALVGVVIPWLNQKKTELLLKYGYGGQTVQTLPKAKAPSWLQSQAGPLQPPVAGHPRFGNALLGHLMKLGPLIDNTAYGPMLVIDVGITGSRGIMASLRELFESLEVVVRDVGSLYFYMQCVPHLEKAFNWLAQKYWHATTLLNPQVMRQFHETLQSKLPDVQNTTQLQAFLEGLPYDEQAAKTLWHAVRQAPSSAFKSLLTQECQIYLGTSPQMQQALENALRLAENPTITVPQLEAILAQLEAGTGAFESFSADLRGNASRALKQAFRHTVGASLSELTPWVKGDALLAERLERAIVQDSLETANVMFRRCLVAAEQSVALSEPLKATIQAAESVAALLEKVALGHLSISDLSVATVESQLNQLTIQLEGSTKGLVESYGQQLLEILKNPAQGRLYALETGESLAEHPALERKLKSILTGGFEYSPEVLRDAVKTWGYLPENLRGYVNPAKATEIYQGLTAYCQTLMRYLEKQGAADLKVGVDQFFKRCLYSRYGSQLLALGGAMTGIGYVIPKIQQGITQALTGKNQHPGIAAVSAKMGAQSGNSPASHSAEAFLQKPKIWNPDHPFEFFQRF